MNMKKLTFLVLSNGVGQPKSFSISFPFIWLSIVLLAVFLGTFGFLFKNYYTKMVDLSTLHKLRAENLLLSEKLRNYEKRLDELNSRMDELIKFDTQLRVMADLEPIDEDVRKVGVGGSLPIEKELRELDPPVAERVESFSSKLDQLMRHTELQFRSFEEIESHLEKSENLRNHTPSIRPCRGWLVSGFGYRKDPFTGKRKFHEGIDIAGPVGTPVYATADGVVESVKYHRGGYGLTIVIDHGYGFKTVYAHLSLSKVKRYQRVKRGEIVGLLGRSGRTTGPHLHYEVRVTGKARNPLTYIIPDESYFD